MTSNKQYQDFLDKNFYFSWHKNKASDVLDQIQPYTLSTILNDSQDLLENFYWSSNKIEAIKTISSLNPYEIYYLSKFSKLIDEVYWDSSKVSLLNKLSSLSQFQLENLSENLGIFSYFSDKEGAVDYLKSMPSYKMDLIKYKLSDDNFGELLNNMHHDSSKIKFLEKFVDVDLEKIDAINNCKNLWKNNNHFDQGKIRALDKLVNMEVGQIYQQSIAQDQIDRQTKALQQTIESLNLINQSKNDLQKPLSTNPSTIEISFFLKEGDFDNQTANGDSYSYVNKGSVKPSAPSAYDAFSYDEAVYSGSSYLNQSANGNSYGWGESGGYAFDSGTKPKPSAPNFDDELSAANLNNVFFAQNALNNFNAFNSAGNALLFATSGGNACDPSAGQTYQNCFEQSRVNFQSYDDSRLGNSPVYHDVEDTPPAYSEIDLSVPNYSKNFENDVLPSYDSLFAR